MTHAQHTRIAFDFRFTSALLAVAFLLATLAASPSQAQTVTVLHNFDLGEDGGVPAAGVTFDQQGRIYGTTSDGGTRHGVVYRLVREGNGWILTPLYTFRGQPDGDSPFARVLFGPDGTLYGTTSSGGASDAGTVFNLRPPASVCHATTCPWLETVIYSFTGGSDGGYPYYGDLTFDSAGNIYGTAAGGGASGNGAVFKLTRSNGSWTESVLWNFTGGDDGAAPYSGVIFDSTGNLYGTASYDGSFGYGTLYELSPSQSGWTEKTLYSFNEHDGGSAVSGLAMDATGNLFGVTGNQEPGAAYELSPSNGSWTLTVLATFLGQYPGPFATPTLDAQGNLWGTLPTGGSGFGEVFKLSPSSQGWLYSDFFNFDDTNGYGPVGNVTFDAQGNLYGTTEQGGTRVWGTVWMITP